MSSINKNASKIDFIKSIIKNLQKITTDQLPVVDICKKAIEEAGCDINCKATCKADQCDVLNDMNLARIHLNSHSDKLHTIISQVELLESCMGEIKEEAR